jgi:hypothetical protein
MKHLFSPILLTALLIGSTAHAGVADQAPPAEIAARFYRAYLRLKIEGLPDNAQYRVIAPMLSADLRRLIQIARRKQAKFIAEHPDEKPPWVEGDLFSSLFERAQSFRLGPATVQGARARIPVHLEYTDGKDKVRWADTLVLVQTSEGWLIWDIHFNGDWQFKTGSNLRQALQAE